MNQENHQRPDQQPMPHPSVTVQSLTPGATPAQSPPSARAASGIPPIQVQANVQFAIPVAEIVIETATPKRIILSNYWRKISGGSLTLSLFIHIALIALFIKVVISTAKEQLDSAPPIGFIASGKAPSPDHQIPARRRQLGLRKRLLCNNRARRFVRNRLAIPSTKISQTLQVGPTRPKIFQSIN